MKKIIEYKIASGESKYELQEEVNELIKQGWQPYGEICIKKSGGFLDWGEPYSQPIVKYEKE